MNIFLSAVSYWHGCLTGRRSSVCMGIFHHHFVFGSLFHVAHVAVCLPAAFPFYRMEKTKTTHTHTHAHIESQPNFPQELLVSLEVHSHYCWIGQSQRGRRAGKVCEVCESAIHLSLNKPACRHRHSSAARLSRVASTGALMTDWCCWVWGHNVKQMIHEA